MKLTDECFNNNLCHVSTVEFRISFCAHDKFVFNLEDSSMYVCVCVCVYSEQIHPHSQFALLRVFITSNIYTKGRAVLCRSGAGGRTPGEGSVNICLLFTDVSITKRLVTISTVWNFGLCCSGELFYDQCRG